MKYLVLGAGMVGSAMAADLVQEPDAQVSVADFRSEVLAGVAQRYPVQTLPADLSDPERVKHIAQGYDVVLGALSSALGFQTLRAVIEAGRPYVDISFMAEDALVLSEFAHARGVTAIVDCGVAPGMSNMLAGYAVTLFETCESLEIYVGGVPLERRWPYQYKAGFSPHDVIEEYTRPSRLVENGQVVVREPLSEPELLDFPGVGTLEAFNTDGLRSLVQTLRVPNMKEKTMRYPGHAELMRIFRDTGFFSRELVQTASGSVRPLELTAALLFPKWAYTEGEVDLTLMRVNATGQSQGHRTRWTWDLSDRADLSANTRSMSRTTAFPATIVARKLAQRTLVRPGVHPPEVLGQIPEFLPGVLAELRARGVHYTCRSEAVV